MLQKQISFINDTVQCDVSILSMLAGVDTSNNAKFDHFTQEEVTSLYNEFEDFDPRFVQTAQASEEVSVSEPSSQATAVDTNVAQSPNSTFQDGKQ